MEIDREKNTSIPYVILYAIIENSIIITCIAHQKRNPRYFADKAF